MNKIFTKLQILRHLFNVMRDATRTEEVFAIVDKLQSLDDLRAKFPDTPEMRAYLRAPFSQGFPELVKLRAMPEGSLGRALAAHMDELGVDFSQFDRKPTPRHDRDHIDRHIYQVHDIWHTLTGFGPGPANEIGLLAFTLAQLEALPPLTLLSLATVRLFAAGQGDIAPTFDAIAAGWQQGRAARNLFGVDWRDHFERPLAEVRREFGVVAIDREQLVEIDAKLAA